MNLITIHNTTMPVVEYRGQRVVTLAMIDQVHERPEGTARRNFNEHRDRFVEGRDCFEVTADDIRTQSIAQAFAPRTAKGVLLTERGYMLLTKPFNDDLAWDVQSRLVDEYFRTASPPALPGDYITALEHLLATKRSEQLAIEQRDHAVATKAEIGTRREATAMATASAAVRQVRTLQAELGRGCLQATVSAVEKAAKRKFGKQGFRPLKNWCALHGVAAPKVLDSRYGWVRSWPAAAWEAVYQIDLADLFGADGDSQC
ncbi:ORF6N domain-containing protein [Pseudomonas baltica]|uniref:ORF6N domain-containing protein n=1 Tax=Pseudomonas baltica TaxID=2762576 RepID=UPI00289C8523|nr:ORF6N domain-containing protein [Pseudomonas baltica]